MCRFLAYKGRPILLDELLYQPKNSLINQSARAHEAEEPLNGDGFGVGWYTPELTTEPGRFVSVRPAWNDRNLRSICRHIRTATFFAHVRAASEGEVTEANCHPFQQKELLFMHNGALGGFQQLKRKLRSRLNDAIYNGIHGQTDSEHLFALVLEKIGDLTSPVSVVRMANALEAAIVDVQRLKDELGINETCYINCALTDGRVMVAARYVSDLNEKASTLYVSEGKRYECRDGVCVMLPPDSGERSILIVSEKLTQSLTDWKEIPTNHLCTVDETLKVALRPISEVLVRAANGATTRSGFNPRSGR